MLKSEWVKKQVAGQERHALTLFDKVMYASVVERTDRPGKYMVIVNGFCVDLSVPNLEKAKSEAERHLYEVIIHSLGALGL